MRFKKVASNLRAFGFGVEDIDALIPDFIHANDDVVWLDEVLGFWDRGSHKLNVPKIRHIRDKCPEVAQVYRFLKLLRFNRGYPNLPEEAFMEFALEVAATHADANILHHLLRALEAANQNCSLEDLKELYAAFKAQGGAHVGP
jgi:hypothetical protein